MKIEKKLSKREFFRGLGKGALAAAATSPMLTAESAATTYSNTSYSPNIFPKTIKPNLIAPGATIGLVATATLVSEEAIRWAISNLERLGFAAKLGKNVREKFGYLAGTDDQRAKDLNEMFSDSAVEAIWCLKGGWGSARILDRINYGNIKDSRKPIVGYSDVTSLLSAIHRKTGLITYHGPNAVYGESEYTEQLFLETLTGRNEQTLFSHEDAETRTIRGGRASGRLVGGNLTVLTSIIGSGYEPDFQGTILFLEDVSEPAYKVDRMLTQLQLSGVLNKIRGVVFGTCARCTGSEKAFSVEQVLRLHFERLNIPSFIGASIGHVLHKMTLAIGARVKIDAYNHTIQYVDHFDS